MHQVTCQAGWQRPAWRSWTAQPAPAWPYHALPSLQQLAGNCLDLVRAHPPGNTMRLLTHRLHGKQQQHWSHWMAHTHVSTPCNPSDRWPGKQQRLLKRTKLGLHQPVNAMQPARSNWKASAGSRFCSSSSRSSGSMCCTAVRGPITASLPCKNKTNLVTQWLSCFWGLHRGPCCSQQQAAAWVHDHDAQRLRLVNL